MTLNEIFRRSGEPTYYTPMAAAVVATTATGSWRSKTTDLTDLTDSRSDRPRRPAALHFINPYKNIGIMTRSEFDQQVRELKNKKGNAIREIAALQSEVKEEIASKWRQIEDIKKDISKLSQSLQGYHQRRIALENEWNAKVNAFIKENEPSTTSNLAEATTLNIVYELRRRGFDGVISRLGEEPNDYESYDLQKQFEPKKFEEE